MLLKATPIDAVNLRLYVIYVYISVVLNCENLVNDLVTIKFDVKDITGPSSLKGIPSGFLI